MLLSPKAQITNIGTKTFAYIAVVMAYNAIVNVVFAVFINEILTSSPSST
jgi:hypothetical protein